MKQACNTHQLDLNLHSSDILPPHVCSGTSTKLVKIMFFHAIRLIQFLTGEELSDSHNGEEVFRNSGKEHSDL